MKGKFKSVSKILPILLLVACIGIAVLTPVHQAQATLDETSFWYNPVDYIYRWATTDAKETVYEYSAKIAIGLVHFVASSALKLLDWLVHWAAWAVNIFLDPDIYHEVLFSPAIDIGWTICRDLCNLFFVLILLAIAFATIFRIQAYSAKALLPKFILAIFLINFSRVIATIVIDFGQILMFQFVTWMGNFGPIGGGDDGAMSCLTAVSRQFVRDYPVSFIPNMEQMMGALFAAIFVFVLMFIYLIFAAFLLIRLIVLGLLIVLSPFAFMSVILPGTRSQSSKWWGSLFKYVLFGPIFVFFIYLSSEMGQHLMGAPGTPLEAGNYNVVPPSQLTEVGEGGNENIFKVLVYFIKGGIVMGMLLASIFMTKSMGMIGASSLIGGTAGIGLMAGKAYRGARYGAGKAKGAVSAPISRGHAALKGSSKRYKDVSEGISKTLKHSPIGGRMVIKLEAEKAEKLKGEVSKHEKVMDNLTDKDKKAYVDSFKVDMKAKGAAQQAMFNLLAKDNGKGLTDDRLRKAGYEKDVTDAHGKVVGKEFDKEKFDKDVGRAMAHGFNTTNIETYRPDVIKDEGDKLDRVAKVVADGDEKKIKLNALNDPEIAGKLQELIGKRRYEKLINDKSQEEKDGLIKNKETKIAQEISGGTLAVGSDDLRKRQEEIAVLAGADKKEEKMKNINRVNVDGSLHYQDNVNVEIAKNVMSKMSKDQFLDLESDFLKTHGQLISETATKHIDKFGDPEQLENIRKAIETERTAVQHHMGTYGLTETQLTEKLNKIDQKIG